jgi:predicted phosphodiesterase
MAVFLGLSDTHGVPDNIIKYMVREAQHRGADVIIHCGDIEAQHLNAELFGNLPVVCALNKEQLDKEAFKIALENPPPGWRFTVPGNRVVDIEHVRCYVGHKFSFNMYAEAEDTFKTRLDILRRDSDGLRLVLAGHMHHQAFVQTLLVTFLNPGAIERSPDGYEFAIIDTITGQVVFSRIPKTKYLESPFTVGFISDSLDISKRDSDFWRKLALEFSQRDVSQVIHIGNIALSDIGREELANLQVWYRLRSDQINPKEVPENWHLIPRDPPIVIINERQFYVHPNLAKIILEKSEGEMHRECLKISELHPEISVILYGNTSDAYMAEEIDGRTTIMNPGHALFRNFATACFPNREFTIGKVPLDPLPEL